MIVGNGHPEVDHRHESLAALFDGNGQHCGRADQHRVVTHFVNSLQFRQCNAVSGANGFSLSSS
jgi:hypothetical protein